MLSEFLSFDESGLFCSRGNFYLDPQQPVVNAVISHAHGDHARSGNTNVYCTPATAAFMELRFKKNAAGHFHLFNYHEPFELNGVTITFIPAGHMLGSAQVLLEYEGVRYLYTGDFKLQEDRTCEPFEFVQADVLITETTFADPAVAHPDPFEEIKKIDEIPHNILLGAYSLGKSQRLINMIGANCTGRSVLVHHSILPLNRIYERFSYPPGRYEPYNRKLMKHEPGSLIYVVPPMVFDSYFRAKNVVRVFASGWKRLQERNGFELFISDHADWKDILYTVDKVSPKEVWTLHGNGLHLKEYLQHRIPVKIL